MSAAAQSNGVLTTNGWCVAGNATRWLVVRACASRVSETSTVAVVTSCGHGWKRGPSATMTPPMAMIV